MCHGGEVSSAHQSLQNERIGSVATLGLHAHPICSAESPTVPGLWRRRCRRHGPHQRRGTSSRRRLCRTYDLRAIRRSSYVRHLIVHRRLNRRNGSPIPFEGLAFLSGKPRCGHYLPSPKSGLSQRASTSVRSSNQRRLQRQPPAPSHRARHGLLRRHIGELSVQPQAMPQPIRRAIRRERALQIQRAGT